MAVEVEFQDNSAEVLSELEIRIAQALVAIGATAENYAAENCPVDTGRLRASITFACEGFNGKGSYADNNGKSYSDASARGTPEKNTVYVGTNVEYAPMQEFYDYKHKSGRAHFLRDAVTEHGDDYKELVEKAMKD